jgi:dTDP-4-dehydrorhamnose reductase
VPLTRRDLDLTRLEAIPTVLDEVGARFVINCAAFTDVETAEQEEEVATTINGRAVAAISDWVSDRKGRLLTFSTDYVFDGNTTTPYTESSVTAPLNAYGRSKLVGEEAALGAGALVVRTSWLISGSHPNFVSTILQADPERSLRVIDDQVGSPTVALDLAEVSWAAMTEGVAGLLHLTNQGEATWFRLARQALSEASMDPERVEPCSSSEYPTIARRPSYSVMASERLERLGLSALPFWEESLGPVVSEIVRRL